MLNMSNLVLWKVNGQSHKSICLRSSVTQRNFIMDVSVSELSHFRSCQSNSSMGWGGSHKPLTIAEEPLAVDGFFSGAVAIGKLPMVQ